MTSTQIVQRNENKPPRPERQTSAEQRAQSALFLVPKSRKPMPTRQWKPRMADGLFLTVALAAIAALFWTLH